MILDLLNSDEFDGLVRHALSTFGGGVVASGIATTDQWTALSGGIVVLITILWSIASKKYLKAPK